MAFVVVGCIRTESRSIIRVMYKVGRNKWQDSCCVFNIYYCWSLL